MGEPNETTARCPVCNNSGRSPLWWSKAGLTYRLCDEHKAEARAARRKPLAAVPAEGKRAPGGDTTPK